MPARDSLWELRAEKFRRAKFVDDARSFFLSSLGVQVEASFLKVEEGCCLIHREVEGSNFCADFGTMVGLGFMDPF